MGQAISERRVLNTIEPTSFISKYFPEFTFIKLLSNKNKIINTQKYVIIT